MTDSLGLLEQFVQYTQDSLYAHFHLLLICLCYIRLLLVLERTRAKSNPGSNVGHFSSYLLMFLSSFVFILYFWFCSIFIFQYFVLMSFQHATSSLCNFLTGHAQTIISSYKLFPSSHLLILSYLLLPSGLARLAAGSLLKLTGIASIHFQDQQISRTWQRNRPLQYHLFAFSNKLFLLIKAAPSLNQ